MKFSLAIFLIFISVFDRFVVAQQFETKQIEAVSFERVISRAGKLEFKRTNKLSFKNSGYLTALNVDEGDFFNKGDLLASLETTELKAVKNARYVELLQAKREVGRIKKLIEANLASQQDLDLAETKVEVARETYRVAYYNLEKSEIRAPFNGVVLARFTSVDELQATGAYVLEVAAIEHNLIARVGVTFEEIGFIEVNQAASVTLNSNGNKDGVVSKVPAKANAAGNMYLVEITLTDVPVGHHVVADQLAYVNIPLSSDTLVYPVPNSALVSTDVNGNAGLILQSSDGKLTRENFPVVHIDSDFLYLEAAQLGHSLNVVTSGWQQFEFKEF